MLVRIKQITIGKRWSVLVVCPLLSSVYGLYDQMEEASLMRLMTATLRDCRTEGIQCGKYHFMFASTEVVFSKGRETIPFLSEKNYLTIFFTGSTSAVCALWLRCIMVVTQKASHLRPVADSRRIHCLLPFLQKKVFTGLRDSCDSSVTNSFLGSNWRDSGRTETAVLPNNLHKWQQLHSQTMPVWIITNSGNTFLGASCVINVLQRDGDLLIHEPFSCHMPSLNTGFVKEEAVRLLWTNSSRSTFNKKRAEFQNTPKE